MATGTTKPTSTATLLLEAEEEIRRLRARVEELERGQGGESLLLIL
jgi:hypothetical protein